MTDQEFQQRVKHFPSGMVEHAAAIRKVYELCDELGASFVRGVALEWRREDDRRHPPLDNGYFPGGPMTR